jgi:MFS family permease
MYQISCVLRVVLQKCNPGAASLVAAVNRRSTLSLIALLLVLSAMPDTMAAPVLKELFVDRYGATVKEAQVFMAINLLGAVAAVPLLLWWRRRAGPVWMLVIASLADAVLLGLLSAPIGLWSSLAVRAAEGITDVVVFASLFDLVRRNSGPHAARGLGLASTPLLLGLGLGAVAGGLAAQRVAGGSDDAASGSDVALAVFGVSALASVLVAIGALVFRRWLGGIAAVEPETGPLVASGASHAGRVPLGRLDDRPRPLLWSCVMAFFDRATGGLITTTLPLVLAGFLGYTKGQRGWLIGLPLLLMAVCTGPAGALCDRVGSLRVRIAAGVVYALAFAMIPFAASNQAAMAVTMFAVGISAGALFSSSLAIAAESGGSTVALGSFRAAGDVGFFAGTTLSIVLASAIGNEAAPGYADYASVIVLFAVAHAVSTALIAGTAVLASRRGARAN